MKNSPKVPELRQLQKLLEAGEFSCSLNFARWLTQEYPRSAICFATLGLLLMNSEQSLEATEVLSRGLELSPNDPRMWLNLGFSWNIQGEIDRAIECMTRAVECDPSLTDAHTQLARALCRKEQFKEATACIERARQLDPDRLENTLILGEIFAASGRFDEALRCFEKVEKTGVNTALQQRILGDGYRTLGESKKAVIAFQNALELQPNSLEARIALAETRKATHGDPNIDILETELKRSRHLPRQRARIHFALGKMYDDIGVYKDAFLHFEQGHQYRSMRVRQHYDPASDRRQVTEFVTVFTVEFFADREDWGQVTNSPIFVLGFPRSGTSLLEQILDSHSQVVGLGESREVGDLVDQCHEQYGGVEEMARRLTKTDVLAMANTYLTETRKYSPKGYHAIDKMPHNFQHLWLIALMFPCATVIHSCRSPLDTCLSCFMKDFTYEHAYTDKLSDLGSHYRNYRALMSHWKRVIPGKIYDISYEKLITEPRSEIQALLANCHLPYEDACLHFHRSRHAVRTASRLQVRRPLYRSSVGRSHHYEPWLQPLIDAINSEPTLV